MIGIIFSIFSYFEQGQLNMKRKGEISELFLKKHKQTDQVQLQTDPSPSITGTQSSSLPVASQSQCGQTSGPATCQSI